MKLDRPSKNLIVTLPTTASQTTTSAACSTRSRPSTLPMKARSVALEPFRRLAGPVLTLAALLADREEGHGRPDHPEDALR